MPSPVLVSLLILLAQQGPSGRRAAREEYFLSETRATTADGRPIAHATGLTKRSYEPGPGTILETGIAVEPDGLPTVSTVEWTVSGESAEVKERGGRISGKGRLVGPAWAWTEWGWSGTMAGVPGTFRNVARPSSRGISLRTEHRSDDGKLLEVFDQSDTRISKETYTLLRAKLLPE